MYKKGTALELQFSPRRLAGEAGQPLQIELAADEADRLYHALDAYLAGNPVQGMEPLVLSFDDAAPPSTGDANGNDDATAVPANASEGAAPATDFQQFVCLICGWIYDEATGDPEHGLAPGTRWEQVPDDWRCPLCDVGKEDFALMAF
ncbi:rubredoxin [Burkholderia sp. 22PA0099]|uniref:rubredoxin n=1 Tax=Burkholderia sp. 22PA0099 TaxID=3237372 RepID=UPI0039C2591C